MVDAYSPNTLKEVINIISNEECTIFAGGTDLLVKNKRWSGLTPSFDNNVVFISDIGELRQIKIDKEAIIIGAACTFNDICKNKIVPQYIKNVFLKMASPAIRNIATIGGNICNSSPAADSLPILNALESEVILKSDKGERTISLDEFICGPGQNIISKDEILTEIRVPLKDFNIKTYRKIGTRKSTALAKVSFVGLAELSEGIIRDIRLSLGSVAPTVVKSKEIENQIINMSKKDTLNIEKIKQKYNNIIEPIDDQRSTSNYRREVCLRLLEDFLKKLSK